MERGPTKLYWYWGSLAGPKSTPGPKVYCLHSLTTPDPDEPKSPHDAANCQWNLNLHYSVYIGIFYSPNDGSTEHTVPAG